MEGPIQLKHLAGLELADLNYLDKGHIDVLLRASIHARIMEGRIIRGQDYEPIASLSSLGWLISGNCPPSDLNAQIDSLTLHCASTVPLDDLLQRFWKIEELPQRVFYTADEQECEKHFLATHSRNADGRYIVRLPFKVDDPSRSLGNSYTAAFRSLLRMETRFLKDGKLKVAYLEFIQEYEAMNHMIIAAKAPAQKRFQDAFLLPHHGVWKESSTTTKLRTVFNGSVRTSSGRSLNDLLHSDPNLLPNLIDLICR